nr:hypothetical protein [Saprospiraceae bacterium]
MKFAKFSIVAMVCLGMIAVLETGCVHDPIEGDVDPDPVDTTVVENPCEPDIVYFERDILPIFTTNCAFSGCHNAESAQDGVILTSYENVMNSGEVTPFSLSNSDLYEVLIDDDEDKRMPPPPRNKLSAEQINLIAEWILQGAEDLKCDYEMECNLENVSYSMDIRPILENGCIGCHNPDNPSGGVNLDSYTGVKVAAESGRLFGAVNWSPGYVNMPFGGIQISECKIDKIQAWIDQGIKNN